MKNKYFYFLLLFVTFSQIHPEGTDTTEQDRSELQELQQALCKATSEFDINETRKLSARLTTQTAFNSLPSYDILKSNILFCFKDAFVKAAKEGQTDFMLALLEIPGIKVDVNHWGGDGRTALTYVAARGDIDTMRKLLKIPGINVNHAVIEDYGRHTALMDAAKRGDVQMVDVLATAPGINPRKNSSHACRTLHNRL